MVNAAEWWPRRADTVPAPMPSAIAWEAHPWRRSWSRIGGSFACFERRSNCLVTRAGWISEPSGHANTRSSPLHFDPMRRRSAACCLRCASRTRDAAARALGRTGLGARRIEQRATELRQIKVGYSRGLTEQRRVMREQDPGGERLKALIREKITPKTEEVTHG